MSEPNKVSAVESVAQQLGALIYSSYPEGTSLPSEPELAKRFEVSRLTIREALQFLAGRGLVNVGRGRRARAMRPGLRALSDLVTASLNQGQRSLIDLMELRMGLEPLAAGLAAKRISRTGLKNLKIELDGMEDCMRRLDKDPAAFDLFNRHDVQFHVLIADASDNHLISTIMEGLAPTVLEAFIQSAEGQRIRGLDRVSTYRAHAAVYDAIAAGDGDRASAAMRHHLEDTRIDISFLGAVSDPAPE